jgi:hypothetical protein
MGTDEQTTVIVYTDSFRIDGCIALLPGARLTDYIRNARDFIAITNATVSDKSGKKLFATGFLDVGRDRIELIMPAALVK